MTSISRPIGNEISACKSKVMCIVGVHAVMMSFAQLQEVIDSAQIQQRRVY